MRRSLLFAALRRTPALYGVVFLVVLAACAPGVTPDERAALSQEISGNIVALRELNDTILRHANVSSWFLSWAEEVAPAGSANLWDGMKMLRERPAADLRTAAFDDLAARGVLHEAVPDVSLRLSLIDFYGSLERLETVATHEYRRLAEHYEAVLEPGEWRNVFEVELGEAGFPVDYRKNLRALVADNHEAVLRGLIRGQAEYIRSISAARSAGDTLLADMAAQ